MAATFGDRAPGAVVRGPLLPERVEVIAIHPLGNSVKLVAKRLRTGEVRDPILSAAQLAQLTVSPITEPFDGDPARFRLGVGVDRGGESVPASPGIVSHHRARDRQRLDLKEPVREERLRHRPAYQFSRLIKHGSGESVA